MSEAEAASCTGKVRFESYGAAARVQKHRTKRVKQRIYRCKFCRGYHIGTEEPDRPKHEWKRYRERYEGARE